MDRTTVDSAEDQPGNAAMVLAPVWIGTVPDLDFYGRVQLDVPCKGRHCHRRYLDGACRGFRLGRAEVRFLAGDAHELLSDINLGVGEVESVDLQAGDFRAAQAAPSGDIDNGRVPFRQSCGQLVDLFT